MTHATPYGREFFEHQSGRSAQSAARIVPLVVELVAPRSVIDVGCGTGAWLNAFIEAGIGEVLGVDGPWVDRAALRIPADAFREADLTKPLALDRRADLATCLEVAEHLPASSADTLVASLVAAAPIVVFSAAVPFQGGVNHVNEQWPDFWAKLFADHGYVAIDCIRRRIWNDPDVQFWYAQNMLVFAEPSAVAGRPALERERTATGPQPLSLVHPRNYLALAAGHQELQSAAEPRNAALGALLSALPTVAWRTFARKTGLVR